MLYNQCAAVNEEFWRDLRQADPEDIARRTGIRRDQNVFRFPFFNQEAVVDLAQQRVFRAAAPAEEPGFRLCLISLLYLLYVDTAALGPPLSPLELPGATTFFQKRGPHAIPSAPLEERFGRDLPGFFQVGALLGAERLTSGDAALAFQVFPKLPVEVILWEADEEFPAQVSFTVPSHLDRFWQLDAVLGLMGLVVKEMLRAAGPVAGLVFPVLESVGLGAHTSQDCEILCHVLGRSAPILYLS